MLAKVRKESDSAGGKTRLERQSVNSWKKQRIEKNTQLKVFPIKSRKQAGLE